MKCCECHLVLNVACYLVRDGRSLAAAQETSGLERGWMEIDLVLALPDGVGVGK